VGHRASDRRRLRERAIEKLDQTRIALDDTMFCLFDDLGNQAGEHRLIADALLAPYQNCLAVEGPALPKRLREISRQRMDFGASPTPFIKLPTISKFATK
jgi:hypothetical protein